MKLYRFSPIKSKEELFEAIQHVHTECSKLCQRALGRILPCAGNVGIFCHYEDEYDALTEIRKQLTDPSDNMDQKYFRLHEPIAFAAHMDIPEMTYTYLYIRKPDPYRHHVGDVDFYLEPEEYTALKTSLLAGNKMQGARIFERTDLDMIELFDPDSDALAYVSTQKMSEKVA